MSNCEFVTFPLYPGSGVVLDWIDSWSLPSFLTGLQGKRFIHYTTATPRQYWCLKVVFAHIRDKQQLHMLVHHSLYIFLKTKTYQMHYNKLPHQVNGRIQKSSSGGPDNFFYSHQRISQRAVRNLPREAIGPNGSNCFPRGSVPVLLGFYSHLWFFRVGGPDPMSPLWIHPWSTCSKREHL